jgi:hypothetical protein
VAEVHTEFGVLRLPLAWWRAHQGDASYILVVTAVEAAPQRVAAQLAEEESA